MMRLRSRAGDGISKFILLALGHAVHMQSKYRLDVDVRCYGFSSYFGTSSTTVYRVDPKVTT